MFGCREQIILESVVASVYTIIKCPILLVNVLLLLIGLHTIVLLKQNLNWVQTEISNSILCNFISKCDTCH